MQFYTINIAVKIREKLEVLTAYRTVFIFECSLHRILNSSPDKIIYSNWSLLLLNSKKLTCSGWFPVLGFVHYSFATNLHTLAVTQSFFGGKKRYFHKRKRTEDEVGRTKQDKILTFDHTEIFNLVPRAIFCFSMF